jgi:hypothetical protein
VSAREENNKKDIFLQLVCTTCGTTFSRSLPRVHLGKNAYCSILCRNRRGPDASVTGKTCQQCGKPFCSKYKRQFCSFDCFNESKRKTLICPYCKKSFKVGRYKAKLRIYCSKRCRCLAEPSIGLATQVARKRYETVLLGKRFGFVLVEAITDTGEHGPTRVRCTCDCGKRFETTGRKLSSGYIISCGCLRGQSQATHGMSGSVEYRVWAQMKRRCLDPSDDYYANYGGRGIRVCDRWVMSFPAFYEDIGPRPTPKHTIDRINNDGHYEPGNCHWALPYQQSRNKRDNLLLLFQGVTLCATDWAAMTGLTLTTISTRLTHGWTVEEILTTPTNKGRLVARAHRMANT